MSYVPIILGDADYEHLIRSRMGVTENELPDVEINQDLILQMAETVVIRRVPSYSAIINTGDLGDLLFLRTAVIAYICYLLAPSMARRVKTEVSTIDVKWKKGKVDWGRRTEEFLVEFESALANIQGVEVVGYSAALMMIAKATGAL